MVYGHGDFLTDAHFHIYQVLMETNKKRCCQAVVLDGIYLMVKLGGIQTTNLPIGVLIDSCMMSQERRLPVSRAVDLYVFQAFGALCSTLMQWGEKAR